MTSWRIIALGLLLSSACADSGTPRADSGTGDSGTRDSSLVPDACSPVCGDSSAGDTSPSDARDSSIGITVDGVIDDAEWAGAAESTNAVASGWGVNTLTRVLAAVRAERLYLAVEGSLEAGAENALVVYVDESGATTGVGDPIDLTDGDGSLDNAVSAGFTTPADFGVDHAWGTKDLGRAQDGFDDRMGWRNLEVIGDFAWLDAAEAPTVCGAGACETSIPLASLGAATSITLFGRLVNTDGMMISNQCVPEDDPDNPGIVSIVLDVL